jgi:hypothetical protein
VPALLLLAWLQAPPQGQPPAQPPPPAGAAPAPAPDRALETAARAVLQQYSAALESLDAELVKKVQPSVDVEGLKKAFANMRELKVTIENVRILSSEGPSIRVSCRVVQALTPRAGAKHNTTVTRVLRLRRQEAVWVIDGFER